LDITLVRLDSAYAAMSHIGLVLKII